MTNWHDEKEPAVYAPGERQRELEALSPKPPAASGDLDELAARLWRDLPGNRQGDLIQIRAYFAKVAKEAQLRVLRHWPTYDPDEKAKINARLRKVKKEGPL